MQYKLDSGHSKKCDTCDLIIACNFYVWQHPHSEQCEQFNSSNGVVVVAVSSSAQHCVTVPLCFPTFTCPPPMPPTHASLQCSRFEQFQRSARRQPLHPIRLQHVGASLALGTGIDARGTAGNLCSKEGEQRNSDGAQDTTWAIIYSQRSAQSESNFKHPSHKSPPHWQCRPLDPYSPRNHSFPHASHTLRTRFAHASLDSRRGALL